MARIIRDSIGEISLPDDALYGAQTQRACENFTFSALKMPRLFIQALALIKAGAAQANQELALLEPQKAQAIQKSAQLVAQGNYDAQFPIDVFQTGSGTSSNMNANEVIATLAEQASGLKIHPNDDVNMCQSSNDVIPTALHLSALLCLEQELLPALQTLHDCLASKAQTLQNVVKTGRTHLMDAMPLTLGQELSGWQAQIKAQLTHLEQLKPALASLALGGTAVGTGINAHPQFAQKVIDFLQTQTGLALSVSSNYFASLSSQDTAVTFSGLLKSLAVSLMKIANDVRWMNSGPLCGLGEVTLPTLQAGSSIMPGKVNPVICEAVMMMCAQVMGNDTTIMVSGQMGNFQLNVMLPVIAHNLLESLQLLSKAASALGNKVILAFVVNEAQLKAKLDHNPILVTALNSVIGYELGAKLVKAAYQQKRPLIDIALEMTELSRDTLEDLLDPLRLTKGGIVE